MIVDGFIQAFDDVRGDGTIRDDQGRRFTFHCVDIRDGSRTIAVGARARGVRAAGRRGIDEVTEVEVVRAHGDTTIESS